MNAAIKAPKTAQHLEQLRALAAGTQPEAPIQRLVGMKLVEIDVGRSAVAMRSEARHANPMGTLHGGILGDLADLAMGMAMATTLEDDESFTSLDLSVKFLKPVWESDLRATAQVVKRTRTLGLLECDVVDDTGSLVARSYSTCMVLRGGEAKGR